jgi:hypothetical protein
MEDDFVAWHKTKSYTFSVRSAYYSNGSTNIVKRLQELMALVHQEQILSGKSAKVKIVIWCSLHGLIPDMVVLANRHIKV